MHVVEDGHGVSGLGAGTLQPYQRDILWRPRQLRPSALEPVGETHVCPETYRSLWQWRLDSRAQAAHCQWAPLSRAPPLPTDAYRKRRRGKRGERKTGVHPYFLSAQNLWAGLVRACKGQRPPARRIRCDVRLHSAAHRLERRTARTLV